MHIHRPAAQSAVVAILFSLGIAPDGSAQSIKYRFTGTVTSVFVEPSDVDGIDFPNVGDPFSGFYWIDASAPDSDDDPGEGLFVSSVPTPTMAGATGELQFEQSGSILFTAQDQYRVFGNVEVTSDPPIPPRISSRRFYLTVFKDNLLSDPDILPLSPPSLEGASGRTLFLHMYSLPGPPGDIIEIHAHLDSLTRVPAPTSATLIATGLIPLFTFRIRARRYGMPASRRAGSIWNTNVAGTNSLRAD
jgi:hypothetical protein